jgi:hypothetical protein
VQSVLETETDYFARSTWFVICETPSLASLLASDVTYRPESPAARRIIQELRGRGCEVGLHGSFVTSGESGAFERQRQRLGGIVGSPPEGVRQHFLRLRPGETHVRMEKSGFRYDSSTGFSDRNGFRSGVADVLPVWDAVSERALALREAPFCWMDRALSKYRAIEDPEVWVDEGLALAKECRSVEGLWVGVWHPNMHPRLGFAGTTEAFDRLMAEIAADHPFMGSLSSIVRWRVARQGVRARAMDAGGAVRATTAEAAGYPLHLEDASGRTLEPVSLGR